METGKVNIIAVFNILERTRALKCLGKTTKGTHLKLGSRAIKNVKMLQSFFYFLSTGFNCDGLVN